MAVAALVTGILICVPIVTGACAIVFGATSIIKAKDPQVGGKSLAIAGFVLGLVNLFVWAPLIWWGEQHHWQWNWEGP